MAKTTNFVVVQNNTNHEVRVFGPFKTHEEAEGFAFTMAGTDHLHSFDVHELEEPE